MSLTLQETDGSLNLLNKKENLILKKKKLSEYKEFILIVKINQIIKLKKNLSILTKTIKI